MIFVTVGTQLPFPRLVQYMVDLARDRSEHIVVQSGSDMTWPGIEAYQSIPDKQFQKFISEARVMVSHAGIGSILSARVAKTPLVLVPRKATLGEHRNDHQLATAAALEGRKGMRVAWEVEQIPALIDARIERPMVETSPHYVELLDKIRGFVAA